MASQTKPWNACGRALPSIGAGPVARRMPSACKPKSTAWDPFKLEGTGMNAVLRWMTAASSALFILLALGGAQPLAAADRQPAIVSQESVRDPFGALRTEEFAAGDEHWE